MTNAKTNNIVSHDRKEFSPKRHSLSGIVGKLMKVYFDEFVKIVARLAI
ncbi:hypothetical protein AB0758_30875 [Tolypothrix bouteillei VB521301_2]